MLKKVVYDLQIEIYISSEFIFQHRFNHHSNVSLSYFEQIMFVYILGSVKPGQKLEN